MGEINPHAPLHLSEKMKPLSLALITILISGLPLLAQDKPQPHLSIKLEIKRAIERGNSYLKKQQHADGYWGQKKYPALSALTLTAAVRSPSFKASDAITRGYSWIINQQKADGGIYVEGLGTYNTATSLTALVAANNEAFKPNILKARKYLVELQTTEENRGEIDKKHIGGIGYGGTYKHSDLSNTHLAMEALRLSRHIAQDDAESKQPELNWDAALEFVSRTQNLKATNKEKDISDDGSFVYYPGDSKSGEKNVNPDGTQTLRGYGSMSYAGLLSLIYADLDDSDPRVKAVKDWLAKNYTVKENPGLGTKEDPTLGQQGLFYYYQAMAKGLSAANIDQLTLADGTKVDWRKDLGNALLKKQREDGSWINEENSRWWESDPILVTAYSVLALEQLYYSIPK